VFDAKNVPPDLKARSVPQISHQMVQNTRSFDRTLCPDLIQVPPVVWVVVTLEVYA
jgi:hypothetical protein